jgi:hypothetical protein
MKRVLKREKNVWQDTNKKEAEYYDYRGTGYSNWKVNVSF